MFTVLFILALAAAIVTLVHAATGRVQLWVAVLLICIIELLRVLPLGK